MKAIKRTLLRRINNILLSCIAMLGVCSCQSQKHITKPQQTDPNQPAEQQTDPNQPAEQPEKGVVEEPHIMLKYGIPTDVVICMYGAPESFK